MRKLEPAEAEKTEKALTPTGKVKKNSLKTEHAKTHTRNPEKIRVRRSLSSPFGLVGAS